MRESQGDNMSQSSTNYQNTPLLKLVDSSIRVSVIPLSIATIWLTLTNQQDNDVFGKLKFTNFTGLKYMICISFISAIYALLSIVSSWIRGLPTKAWIFFLSDQVIAYLMVTSGAAVLEILYLAYNGDKEISWSEACKSYEIFCSRIKLAFIFHALALCCFILLALISAFRAFTHFDPPNKELEE